MQKVSFTTGVVLIGLASSFAHSVGPVQAPDDVILELGIEGDGHQFHIGELVPVKYSYRSNTSDKYIWVSQSNKLIAGTPLISRARRRLTASAHTQRLLTVEPSANYLAHRAAASAAVSPADAEIAIGNTP